jgi:uncharacterized protein (DUF2252 family)
MKEAWPRRPHQRAPILASRQKRKMAASAHAYVRGSTIRFYEWLEKSDSTLPDGPPVWICGDCHVGNLGPVARADGQIAVQIRDLDQSVVGNPVHDLVRLGLSLATAARGSDLPGVTTARMIEEVVVGYESALAGRFREPKKEHHPDVVRFVMKEARNRSWQELLRERLVDTKPTIPLGERFWPLTSAERRGIEDLFTKESSRKLVTSLRCRDDDASVKVLDAAYWMKGCSSLGLLRCAVLVGVGKNSVRKGRLCLMDIKEAAQAIAPRKKDVEMPRHQGQRVVLGARSLSPFLGERMVHGELLGRPVFMRELLPQDLKVEIDELTVKQARVAARFLANVVGRAHARQMSEADRHHWRRVLKKHRRKSLDAPSWLWSSVVDLVANHESAYLEHCRKYALGR